MKLHGKSFDKKIYLSNHDEAEEIDNSHCRLEMMDNKDYTNRVFQMKTSRWMIWEADLLNR